MIPQCDVELSPDTVMQNHTRVRCYRMVDQEAPLANGTNFLLCTEHLASWMAGIPLTRYSDRTIYRRVKA